LYPQSAQNELHVFKEGFAGGNIPMLAQATLQQTKADRPGPTSLLSAWAMDGSCP
jgi:hypothetical protein|tara:strand:- start:204 stop:368 length:165 start_codon:yes stop_codon:yes gene_type:complete